MIKVTVSYPNQPGKRFDFAYYTKQHMPLVHKRLDALGLQGTVVIKGLSGGAPGSAAPYICIGELTFKTVDAFQACMAAHGKELTDDVPNFTDIPPLFQVSEVVG